MEKTITIRIANTPTGEYDVHQALPYPFHIQSNGDVARQDFWNGDPKSLIGFQATEEHHIDLTFKDFWAAPRKAAGMFPVFFSADGSIWRHTCPVSDVVVNEAVSA